MGAKGTSTRAAGVGLIILSGLFWLALPGVPLLSLSTEGKGALAVTLLVFAEIAFWVGLILVGKEYADWIRKIPGRALTWIKSLRW